MVQEILVTFLGYFEWQLEKNFGRYLALCFRSGETPYDSFTQHYLLLSNLQLNYLLWHRTFLECKNDDVYALIIFLIRSQNEALVSNQQGKYSRGGYTPSHWDPMRSTMQYKRVQLSGHSDEFKEVEKFFKKSIKRRVVITGIERVQNPFMWEKYQRQTSALTVRCTVIITNVTGAYNKPQKK